MVWSFALELMLELTGKEYGTNAPAPALRRGIENTLDAKAGHNYQEKRVEDRYLLRLK